MKVTFTNNVGDHTAGGPDEPAPPEPRPNHRWVLSGDNGEPLSMSSEGYVRRIDCIHGFVLTTGFDFADDWKSAARTLHTGEVQTAVVEGL